jgi:zona occludens toxin
MGKTSLILAELLGINSRPLFVSGVPNLKIDYVKPPPLDEWTELRPDQDDPNLLLPYFTFPPLSIVWLDEAQRVYRPRTTNSKVPDIVAAFETHRHLGLDFYLSTQHVNLLDGNIRRLIGRHIDVRGSWLGRYKYEWVGLGDPDSKSSREQAARTRFKPPSEVFDLYKSAEVHTKPIMPKVNNTMKVFIFVVIFLIIGSYFMFKKVSNMTDKSTAETVTETTTNAIENNDIKITGYFLNDGQYQIILDDSSILTADAFEISEHSMRFKSGSIWYVY